MGRVAKSFPTRVSAEQAHREFDRWLDIVADNGDRIIVRRNGKDVAALIPLGELPLVDEETRRRLLRRVKKIWKRSDLSEDDARELAYSELRAMRAGK
jgi:antitoxin (DNA-binding transcriptional repressor) of toxin-antitoxin stability system